MDANNSGCKFYRADNFHCCVVFVKNSYDHVLPALEAMGS